MDRDAMNKRREQAMSVAMRRKEEYLGARVPKELRDKVILRAKEMGVPVSILIRNVLEEAFGGAESKVVAQYNDSGSNAFDDVIGWEEITLNKAVNCAGCGVQLQPTSKVTLGIGASKPVVVCGNCKSKI